ncbi:low molecular weight protein-tyrosine-phosphatase [Palleronia sp. LCG004]|uniref:low molecular weight protein-tyrosine-phosphatase n=1 Tax=Palleronia sp. LCG004 TaxID=3079304 RepID=UPI002942A6D9|nr:low molecular weight protein-tyrosine-phosphatase [Palleronia sp. LCG004]WOI56954.1 low molecular weight protein-tyrosine-phosphatase [Palleronia sp. LCG004]
MPDPKPESILIVCLGNICRSPTAEAVLRSKLADAGLGIEVDSAGTGDWHVGDPPHADMIAAASRAGYDLSQLRARQIVPEDFERFDLILAADPSNLEDLERVRPAGNSTRAVLFAPYAGRGVDAIPDPYHTGDFDGALDLVEAACDGLLSQLQ